MSVLPYRLRKLIAVRPGVKTYQGTALADGSPVLIHHLHPNASATVREERHERFAALAEQLAKARHPALPALRFWTPRAEDPFYLVYDLPHGTGLDTLLDAGGPLPWEDAIAVLRPVVDGLAEAHERGIAHLGLRPDRVILRREGPPLLVDLGLTQLLLDEVRRPVAINDPLWRSLFPRPELVAPELLGEPRGDARSDVLGLGLLLFHATTLAWPYSSGTSVLVYNQVRAGVRASFLAAALGHAPRAVQELVRSATAADPADRPANARALGAALDALPHASGERDARLDARRLGVSDLPYNARFGEILTVVDGGRGRAPSPLAEVPVTAPPEALDPEQVAALEAERERQIRLAELTLERMRGERSPGRPRRTIGWLVAALVALALALLLPRLVERTSRTWRVYEGGVDPRTGLTHGGPPRSGAEPRRPAGSKTSPPPSTRRPAVDRFSARERLSIEP